MITAAGTSLRMGKGLKKEYRLLGGIPVLIHAITPFLVTPSFYPVVVTVLPVDRSRIEDILSPHVDLTRITLVNGGKTRQQSVSLALEALQSTHPEIVLIHDGARPWLNRELVDRVVEGVRRQHACVPTVPAKDAMKELGENNVIDRHVARERICCAQTPQGFLYASLLAAHREAVVQGRQFIDDAEVFAAFQGPVYSVPGDAANRKITYHHDLEVQ